MARDIYAAKNVANKSYYTRVNWYLYKILHVASSVYRSKICFY